MKKLLIFFPICLAFLVLSMNVYAGPFGINLLSNPGFESGLAAWTTDNGYIRTNDPPPYSGDNYLAGAKGGPSSSYTWQLIDLVGEGFTAGELDSGLFKVDFGGWQAGWHTQTDSGKIEIVLMDESVLPLYSDDLGWFYSNNTWILKDGTMDLLVGTRHIKYGFYAQRYQGTNTDGYLDDAFLTINSNAVPIPSALLLLGSGLMGLAGIRRKFK